MGGKLLISVQIDTDQVLKLKFGVGSSQAAGRHTGSLLQPPIEVSKTQPLGANSRVCLEADRPLGI